MAFDRNKDQVISIDDLRFVMEITGRTHSTEELNAMIRELDVDGDGVATCKCLPLASMTTANE
jgi:Ca2+-binding EF-hand superfamily protein